MAITQRCFTITIPQPRTTDLIDRLKGLFQEHNILRLDSKSTVVHLNNVRIEAFPSHHLDAMRGLKNVSFIFLDEADFFPPREQQDARDVFGEVYRKIKPLDRHGIDT